RMSHRGPAWTPHGRVVDPPWPGSGPPVAIQWIGGSGGGVGVTSGGGLGPGPGSGAGAPSPRLALPPILGWARAALGGGHRPGQQSSLPALPRNAGRHRGRPARGARAARWRSARGGHRGRGARPGGHPPRGRPPGRRRDCWRPALQPCAAAERPERVLPGDRAHARRPAPRLLRRGAVEHAEGEGAPGLRDGDGVWGPGPRRRAAYGFGATVGTRPAASTATVGTRPTLAVRIRKYPLLQDGP